MRKKTIVYYILPSLIILAGYSSYFFYYDRVLNFDWGFFNSFSLLLKSIVLEYHRFPVHDPWVCGGVDILSRPQNWVFSPFIISTLLLPPYVANLFSLILLSFIGTWGMYKLLRHYEVSTTVSIYCALLFVNSGWFGLHIIVGHVAFRSLFLLPIIIYLLLTLTNIKKFVFLTLTMCFFLVDGGIYSFFYSLILIFLLLIFNMVPIKTFISEAAKHWIIFLLATIAFFLVSSAKIIPVLTRTLVPSRLPQYHMSLKEVALSLFDPWLTNFDLTKWDEYMLPFHEFGSYIGILSLFIICWYSRKKSFWRNNLKEILLLLLFLWLATGFGGDINPGTLLKKIPMIKNAHVESRYYIIFMIFYIIVLARVIDRNITSKLLLIIILGLLTLEFIYVRNYSSFEVFKIHSEQIEYPTYITKRNITQTLEEVPKPEVYFQENIASKLCYESIFIPTEVRHIEEKRYRGEVYSSKRDTNIEILEFSPGFIHAEYEYNRLGSTELRFNTNSHYSWVVNEPHKIIENNRNLLRVSVYKGEGVVKLHYKPPYLKYIIIFYTLGVTIYLIILGRMFFKNGLKSKFKNSKTAK